LTAQLSQVSAAVKHCYC